MTINTTTLIPYTFEGKIDPNYSFSKKLYKAYKKMDKMLSINPYETIQKLQSNFHSWLSNYNSSINAIFTVVNSKKRRENKYYIRHW